MERAIAGIVLFSNSASDNNWSPKADFSVDVTWSQFTGKRALIIFFQLGREEVKTLVDLAMMSAGESDIETDRVSFLHTTALGFGQFIFDLNGEVGFIQLMDKCQSVWKEIKENETLPEKLVMCTTCSHERKKVPKK